jgi:tetratricopeptide (TPR) repeat protein
MATSDCAASHYRCTWFALSVQAFARGDWQAALEQFTAALKLDSTNIAARNNRALTYLKLKMFSEAAADCSSLLQADSKNVKALLRRAAAYEALGQQQQALDDLQRVLQLQPQNAEAKARLAVLKPAVAAAAGAADAAGN